MQINQQMGIKPKTRDHKLKSGVNRQGAFQQEGVRQGLGILNFWLQWVCGHLEMSGHQWNS